MIPDFNRLKIFCHVFVHKSVSKAARELNLSQPAVSQHIKKLEKELRIPLFTRTNRKIVPTPAARRLYDRMAPLVEEIKKEIKYIRRPLDTPYGLLRIGASEICGGNYLTSICNKFRYRFPTVTYKLSCADNQSLLSSLARGDLDLALIEQVSGSNSSEVINTHYYTCETVLSEPLVLVCSKSYFNRHRTGVQDLEQLSQREYLTTTSGRIILELWFQHHYDQVPNELNYVLTTDNSQPFLDGIRNGMGLGVIPLTIASKGIDSGALQRIVGSADEIISSLSLVQLRNKSTSLTEKAFSAVLKKEFSH